MIVKIALLEVPKESLEAVEKMLQTLKESPKVASTLYSATTMSGMATLEKMKENENAGEDSKQS